MGADGSRSRVRSHSRGDGEPRRTNVVVWRSMPPFEHRLLPLGVLRQAYGPGKMFHEPEGLLVRRRPRLRVWGATGDRPEARAPGRVRDWAEPVVELLRATPETEITRTRIFDRPPARRWGTVRVTLAGDAAHPMMPTLGQGASTGIEDGVVLAKHLSQAGSLADSTAVGRALQAYEADRIARTSPLVKNAHRFAPFALASNPVTTRLRDLLLHYSADASWQRRFTAQHSYEP